MNKRFKSLLLLFSMMFIVSLLLVACSDSEETEGEGNSNNNTSNDEGNVEVDESGSAMGDYGVGDTFRANEEITFTMMFSDHPNYPYQSDWLLLEEIKERTNVSLDMTIIPMSDYTEKRSLLISTGDSPLIIPKTYPGEETPFVASGAILPISDYVDYMPHYQDKVEKWEIEPFLEGLRH